MTNRRAQPQRREELPDPSKPRAGRLPEWGAEIDQAALLVARGHGSLPRPRLMGEGTQGSVFDPDW